MDEIFAVTLQAEIKSLQMKTKIALLTLLFACPLATIADETVTDTLRTIDMDDIIIIAQPKENRGLRELPTAVSRLTQLDMRSKQITGIKSLTAVVPNLFIPDYGSRLTTAVYIRGVGSRINTPAVGLYVDNIPYIDKSAFDFNYADIEQIEVLRGPQSMLYGRNTMGGLIKVQTKSPFSYQGTDIRLGAATYGDYNASLTHYHRISSRFAFSAGGFYEHEGGFFKNSANQNQRIDHSDAGGGRLHSIFLPSDNLKMDLNLSYEYSDQGGYPYYYIGISNSTSSTDPLQPYLNQIAYNDPSGYQRSMLNGGLNIEYQARNFITSFITGYQHLNDRMDMDQDFSPRDYFTLTQKQRSNTLSEEIVLKSKPGKRWQWTTGAFGFYQQLKTEAPVTFKEEGIQDLIESNVNSLFPSSSAAPSMQLSIHNNQLSINGKFSTPSASAAIYHQSTLNDLFIPGLSATIGLRLDYEKMWLDYQSASAPMDFGFAFAMGPMRLEDPDMQAVTNLNGKLKHDYLQLLPKFSLQYEWSKDNNIYLTAAKGYRSGGYNIQMFSDMIQSLMRNDMKQALMESPQFQAMASMIDQMLPDVEVNVEETALYRPEYSWSYEIGAHLSLPSNKLDASLAAFYMDTRDQQVARFSENGFGRMTVNAGRSRSIGAEAEVRAQATPNLLLQAAYGLTHATFRSYATNRKDDTGTIVTTDYSGQFVPFVPRHTLTLSGSYTFRFRPQAAFRHLLLNLCYNGAGKIYWTEQNDMAQDFYGTLNARVSTQAKKVQIDLWGSNLLGQQYAAFYFESLGNRFIQKGKPRQFGIDLRFRF